AFLRATHFTAALTCRASGWRRSGLGAPALAAVARLEQPNRYGFLGAARNFPEGHRHRDFDVGSGARTTAAARRLREQVAESAESAEIAHEDAERLGQIDGME